jgi:hypothetical protein
MKQQRRLKLSGIQVGITGECLVAAGLLAAARKLAIRLYWMVRTNTGLRTPFPAKFRPSGS